MTSYGTIGSLGEVEIGPMRQSERSFVLSSWTESLVDAMGHGVRSGSRHRHAYLVSTGRDIERLTKGSTLLLVARDAECEARAYGWIAGAYVGQLGALYWCFTKRDHRREGVARALFDALRDELGELSIYTHKSRHSTLCERLGLRFQALEGKRSA